MVRYDAVLFDLLTALIDSWTLWNSVAGSEALGRRWRAAYLRLTYGAGNYQPYESLVAKAAAEADLPARAAKTLEEHWRSLPPWDDAVALVEALQKGGCRLGVVTNCSERLGREAASLFPVPWDVVVTAEAAGFYKPHPRPYELALEQLGLARQRVLFVAGSGYDLIGTARVGLDTYWHNRVGLERPEGAPAPLRESQSLEDVREMVFP